MAFIHDDELSLFFFVRAKLILYHSVGAVPSKSTINFSEKFKKDEQ